ncbi:hypothetical protein ABZ318_29530 [Streptomyces sp. NPDC006197]|uniref:hypothetical protein n=1 Tax=Streptomyces sp. NPDC006197 TaxID=3156685 RepID=UPI0033ADF960
MPDPPSRTSRTRTAVILILGALVLGFLVVVTLGDGIADLTSCKPPGYEDDGACLPPGPRTP